MGRELYGRGKGGNEDKSSARSRPGGTPLLPQIAGTLLQGGRAEKPHHTDIERRRHQDLHGKKQIHVVQRRSDKSRGRHDQGCRGGKREKVGHGLAQAQPDLAMDEIEPHAQRQDVDAGVGADHHVDAIRIGKEHDGQLGQPHPDGIPQHQVRAVLRDDQVQAKELHGSGKRADTQDLHQRHAVEPLRRHGDQRQLAGDKRQPEHGRKGHESRETEHLAEHPLVAFPLFGDVAQDGLRHFLHRARDHVAPHVGPLVGLIIDPHLVHGIETPQDDGEQAAIDHIADVRGEELATEAEHLLQRAEGDRPRGPPTGEIPEEDRVARRENNALRHQPPIGIAPIDHGQGHEARRGEARHGDDGLLFHLQGAEQIGARCHAEAGNEEAQEGVTGQGGEFGQVVGRSGVGLLIELRDERGKKEQHDIQQAAHAHVEPEDRVVVLVPHFLPVGQGRAETTVLQHVGNEREHLQQPHHAIIGRRKHAGQENAE